MRRRAIQIYEETSAVGGALSTGVIDVEEFETIDVGVYVAGAPSGTIQVFQVSEKSTIYRVAVAAGLAVDSQSWFTLGGGGNPNAGVLGASRAPAVPRRIQVQVSAAAGAQVYLSIYGTKHED